MLFQLTPSAMPEGYGDALISLAVAKAWLAVEAEETEFDELIEALRDAGVEMVEAYTSLYLAPRTSLEAVFAGFGARMRVGRGPLVADAVTGVSYVDADGGAVDIEDGGWRLDMSGGLIPAIGACWPTSYGPVTVTFDAGYPDGMAPKALLSAAKLFMAHLFANREAVVLGGASGELPLGFCTMCDRYRMPVI